MSHKDDLVKIHTLALQRFERIENKERDQRSLAVEDLKFAQVEDGQWDEDAKTKRGGRPRYTLNRVASAIDQLIGDQRQNRTDIKIRAVGGGSDDDVAKVMTGIIRNIESQSKASRAYDNAFDEVVNGGYGGWRVTTEFSEDNSFEQDIKINPILTATTSLWFDTSAESYDKRDAEFAFVTVDMSKEEHDNKFKDKQIVDWPQERFSNSLCKTWVNDDTVRVAEYWIKNPVTKNIALLSDGRVIDQDEEQSVLDELSEQGVTVVKTRSVKTHEVQMYLIDGSSILEGPKKWAGKFIPLIPQYGRQSHIEGQTFTRGIVRFSKDAQRIYNYATSAAIETAALSPKDPIWYTPAQILNHESAYTNFNTRNSPFMPYNPDPKTGGASPQRGGAPAVQGAFLQQIQQASMDLYHVTGMQPPSIGANPELKSGKAIQAQERLGDRGSFVFSDNAEKSKEYTAEILLDLIPRIYDTQRQVRIMGRDGGTEQVFINQEVVDSETGEAVLVNDLSVGKYDVTADTGPAFATQRQESAQQLIELTTGSPQFEALAMDLIAKDLPILESEELAKRVRKVMILQGVITPTEEEKEEFGLNQQQQPDPQQEAITENIQIQTEKLISDIENQDADTISKQIKAQQDTIKSYETMMKTFSEQLQTGIPLTQSDHDMRIKQQDIIVEGQQALDEGPNREQAEDIVNSALAAEQQAAQGDTARRLTVEQPSASVGQDNI